MDLTKPIDLRPLKYVVTIDTKMALSVLADIAHRRAISREQVFHDHLNPLERYNDKQFLHGYRVRKDTARNLVLLMPELYHATKRSHALEPILQLCVALRFLASGAYYMVIGDTANISEASVHRCVKSGQGLVTNCQIETENAICCSFKMSQGTVL